MGIRTGDLPPTREHRPGGRAFQRNGHHSFGVLLQSRSGTPSQSGFKSHPSGVPEGIADARRMGILVSPKGVLVYLGVWSLGAVSGTVLSGQFRIGAAAGLGILLFLGPLCIAATEANSAFRTAMGILLGFSISYGVLSLILPMMDRHRWPDSTPFVLATTCCFIAHWSMAPRTSHHD